jgi:hypothetical protein
VTANPTNLTAISDMAAKAVIIRRNHWSTSSDSAVIIRRKLRSRSAGIHNEAMAGLRAPFVERLLQRVQHEIRMRTHRRLPTHDAPREHVDDEGYVDEVLPGR